MRKTIFERMDERGIRYAVVIARWEMECDIQRYTNDYFVIVRKKDADDMRLKSFHRSDYTHIFERTLNSREVKQFREMLPSMVKVVHNRHGRVYELKDRPFIKWGMGHG